MKRSFKKTNIEILKSIPNPVKRKYKIEINCPEITFEGENKQPDFCTINIVFYPSAKTIELKSLKQYFYQFRNMKFSYERLINVLYDDINFVYNPKSLAIKAEFNPRGGISSILTVDSRTMKD